MSGSTINIECPKCGQKINQPLGSLESTNNLVCPGCGLTFDLEEVKRGIKEAIQKAKFSTHIVKVRLKL